MIEVSRQAQATEHCYGNQSVILHGVTRFLARLPLRLRGKGVEEVGEDETPSGASAPMGCLTEPNSLLLPGSYLPQH